MLHLLHVPFTTIEQVVMAMFNGETELQVARRQAEQAQARVKRQQALVDALTREGVDALRQRRELAELKLMADLLQDRVMHLEAASSVAPHALVIGQMSHRGRHHAVNHG